MWNCGCSLTSCPRQVYSQTLEWSRWGWMATMKMTIRWKTLAGSIGQRTDRSWCKHNWGSRISLSGEWMKKCGLTKLFRWSVLEKQEDYDCHRSHHLLDSTVVVELLEPLVALQANDNKRKHLNIDNYRTYTKRQNTAYIIISQTFTVELFHMSHNLRWSYICY